MTDNINTLKRQANALSKTLEDPDYSKSCDRYVNLAQSYLDTEMDRAFYEMDRQ